MPTDQLPEHIRKPHLRPIQPLPMMKDGRQFIALRDPAMLTQQMLVLPAQVAPLLQMLTGRNAIEDIAGRVQADVQQLIDLTNKLDEQGLLWGPTFEQLETKLKASLDQRGAFPPRSSQALGDSAEACRTALDQYFDQTEDPEIEGEILGIVAPHLDYQRGWPNYAAAYYGLRGASPPDRVVILGTNHHGIGDGAVMTEYGFQTPLGECPPDRAVLDAMIESLGRPVIVDQLDHMGEHSIELQLPWLQHCFGDLPIVAALVPDPLAPMIEDDDQRIDMPRFVDALRDVLKTVGGRTLFVASSDLSHVGPQFGEPVRVDEQRRIDVEQVDREMMGKFLDGDAEGFIDAMKWNNNATRWCSVGNMAAALMLACPATIELIDYRQAYDDKGMVMVTSAAMVMV